MANFVKLSGKDGKSAYEIWLEQGNSGTEQDFLNSLKGEKGEKGDRGLKGEHGIQGETGPKGEDGKDGTSVTITKVTEINVDGGSNVVTFSDGKTLSVKNGSKGSTGANGTNGKDGENGQDGVSPTVSVNKSGNVTTIAITDKNGTKTATINDGADGANGKDGKDGKDYVLTENDKTEIANEALSILQSDGIPSYWNGAFTDKDGKTYTKYLDEKIARVKALQNEGGRDCFSFVMITDTHYPSNLGKISPLLARKIINDCNIKFALNGGDVQTRGCYQTKAEILSQNKQVAEMFAPIKDKTLQIEGNHDGSYCWSGGVVNSGTAYVKQLTEQEMFEEYYRKNGLNGNVVFDENSNAFYIDDTANKVRYIGLNSMNVPNEPTDINADGTALYPKMHKTQFLQAQYDFLCNEALITLPSDNWSVVVFGHSGIYNAGDYAVMVDVLSAYKNKSNCVVEYEGTESGGEAYTNLAEPLPNNTTDTSKWVKEHRISSSGITSSSGAGKTVCNFIPCKKGDIVRIKGVAFVDSNDRYQLFKSDKSSFDVQYISSPSASTITSINKVGDVYEITFADNLNIAYIRFAFSTPTNPESVIITVNQPIVEAEHGYDYVSVNKDFTNAKGKFIAYFHGHEHQDKDYTRDSIKDIATRCDAQEEYEEVDRAERVKGTITEQSFDVFTINKAKKKIYATKIGAGVDREINY